MAQGKNKAQNLYYLHNRGPDYWFDWKKFYTELVSDKQNLNISKQFSKSGYSSFHIKVRKSEEVQCTSQTIPPDQESTKFIS